MANEATLVFETHPAIPFTVADGAGLEKGTLVQITDPNTVTATAGDGNPFVGVTKNEKIASDGRTTVAVYLGGIFKMTDSGAGCTVGDMLKVAGANTVAISDEAGAGDRREHVGMALETAAAGDTFLVLVGGK
jgi:hypothetical protein